MISEYERRKSVVEWFFVEYLPSMATSFQEQALLNSNGANDREVVEKLTLPGKFIVSDGIESPITRALIDRTYSYLAQRVQEEKGMIKHRQDIPRNVAYGLNCSVNAVSNDALSPLIGVCGDEKFVYGYLSHLLQIGVCNLPDTKLYCETVEPRNNTNYGNTITQFCSKYVLPVLDQIQKSKTML